jgi:hypothetical protein
MQMSAIWLSVRTWCTPTMDTAARVELRKNIQLSALQAMEGGIQDRRPVADSGHSSRHSCSCRDANTHVRNQLAGRTWQHRFVLHTAVFSVAFADVQKEGRHLPVQQLVLRLHAPLNSSAMLDSEQFRQRKEGLAWQLQVQFPTVEFVSFPFPTCLPSSWICMSVLRAASRSRSLS